MAIALPKIQMPQLDRKTALIAGGVVVALAAGGGFAWDTFISEPPPPPPKPMAVKPKPVPAPAAAPAAPAPAPVAAAPAPAPAPAPMIEARPVAAKPAAPMADAPRRRSRANEDARECLSQPTDLKIAACAEKFR
ncbi:MAG: hypothetical protein ACKVP9_17390 [Burkholderiales bacterium]